MAGPDDRGRTVEPVAKIRRDFRMHLGTYLIINVLFAAIWALTGMNGIWPVWVLLFWGVGVAFHGLYAYVGVPDGDDS